jgi:hypothetical protein
MTPGHEPRKEFFYTDPSPHGRGPKSQFHTFYIKIRFYWYLKRVMSLKLDRVGRGSKVPLDPKSTPHPKKCPSTQSVPDLKSAPQPKKCPSTQKVSLDPKSAPDLKSAPDPKSAPTQKVFPDPKI